MDNKAYSEKTKWGLFSGLPKKKRKHVDLVSEAERIVSGCYADELAAYTRHAEARRSICYEAPKRQQMDAKKKDAGFDILLDVVMILSCVTLCVVLGMALM